MDKTNKGERKNLAKVTKKEKDKEVLKNGEAQRIREPCDELLFSDIRGEKY